MQTSHILTHQLDKSEIPKIPPVRPLRTALLQPGIAGKILMLLKPHQPVYNPDVEVTTLGNILTNNNDNVDTHSVEKKITKVMTSIETIDDLFVLLRANDIVIVHWRSLPEGNKFITSLQQEGYKISVIAQKWNESPTYVIENTPQTYTMNR